jgi:type III restriction enzyme
VLYADTGLDREKGRGEPSPRGAVSAGRRLPLLPSGRPLFDEYGDVAQDVTFPDLAAHIFFSETGVPIRHDDVTKPAARIFISHALEAVMGRKSYTLDQLALYKYEVRRVMAEEIQKLRETREVGAFAALFPAKADQFVTSSKIEPLLFDEAKYAPSFVYGGATKFARHYFPLIGDLKEGTEEFTCATHIDRHPKTKFWVRNLSQKPNVFWLQTAKQKFYPDFVVRLKDGRTLVVEYKGKTWAELQSEKDKEIVGRTWAEASGGTCLFVMPVAKDFVAIDREIEVR